MHLEVDIVSVSDVDRSKEFYERLGWRLDDDVRVAEPGRGTGSPTALSRRSYAASA
jgi:catechol 2,3-dioxygenase-like lactoylglutathione lyase family enzyme